MCMGGVCVCVWFQLCKSGTQVCWFSRIRWLLVGWGWGRLFAEMYARNNIIVLGGTRDLLRLFAGLI